MKKKALYICYFSLREPLVQTQVIPYLKGITKINFEMHLLTFEPSPAMNWSKDEIEKEKAKLLRSNIHWDFLTYHKRPSVPATAFDILSGTIWIWLKNRSKKFDVLHARIHVPMMMAVLARKLSFHKPKIIFDIRGFFPEEYADAGIWRKDGLLFKTVKTIEKWLIREADGFVVLTEKAREILFPESKKDGFDKLGRPVEVIPCCVDLERFKQVSEELRKKMRNQLNIEDRFVIVYLGALGGWYMTEETADFLAVAKRVKPETFALILTQSNPEIIRKLLLEKGFSEKDFFIAKVSPTEVQKYLCVSDLAISFRKPLYSKLASSPTKNAEYLICGLPIVANDGIGDTSLFIREDKTGVILEDFSIDSYEKALTQIDEMLKDRSQLRSRCIESARNRFDLKIGEERYRRLYERVFRK